jgi:hypothetical protein
VERFSPSARNTKEKLSRQARTSTAKNTKNTKNTKEELFRAKQEQVPPRTPRRDGQDVFLLGALGGTWSCLARKAFFPPARALVELILAAMTEDAVAKEIVDAAYHIHTTLGPGLFESVYEAVLASELEKRGLHVDRQHPIPIV